MTIAMQQRAAGHESNGRFAKGNAGGPGNPHVRRIALMRAAVAEAVTVEDLVAVMRKLVALAMEGDREAAKLVLHSTIGKPADVRAERHLDLREETSIPAASTPPPAGQNRVESERLATAPSVLPSVAPTAGERLLERRGEREKSVEAMLGIAPVPPIANGGNGAASTPKISGGPRGSEVGDSGRTSKS